jgi:uncharacterized protein (DUF1800 family)
MAIALSKISVTYDQNCVTEDNPNAPGHYYDALNQNAFGGYGTLISNVTQHRVTGHYRSMHKNRKRDQAMAIRPDENLGREIMQLLSVSLVRLNTDGTVFDGEP